MQTPPDEIEKQADHLVKLARSPGFWQHAMVRVEQLEADRSGLFAGLRAEVDARLVALQFKLSASQITWLEKMRSRAQG